MAPLNRVSGVGTTKHLKSTGASPMPLEHTYLQLSTRRVLLCCGQEGSSRDNSGYTPPTMRLFHVRGTNDFNTQAIEVSARCANLNSNDVFVLSTENCCFLWYGKVSSLCDNKHSQYEAYSYRGYDVQ